MKRLFLIAALALSVNAVKAVQQFEHEELLAKMYLQVDVSECPRISMQQLAKVYLDWVNDIESQIANKEDAIYVARIHHLFEQVFLSYHYGN